MGESSETMKFTKSISLVFLLCIIPASQARRTDDDEYDALDYDDQYLTDGYRALQQIIAMEQQTEQDAIRGQVVPLQYNFDIIDLRKSGTPKDRQASIQKFLNALEQGKPTDLLSDFEYDALTKPNERDAIRQPFGIDNKLGILGQGREQGRKAGKSKRNSKKESRNKDYRFSEDSLF